MSGIIGSYSSRSGVISMTSSKSITFTRNMATAAGTYSYTGVGFRPRAALFYNVPLVVWGEDIATEFGGNIDKTSFRL